MNIVKPSPEFYFWLTALSILAFYSPEEIPFSLCFFKYAGLPFCPGCGIGHSIHYFFHGDILKSFHAHPFGMIAVLVILHRMIKLWHFYFRFNAEKKTTLSLNYKEQ